MSMRVEGIRRWAGGTRDVEGHRTWKVVLRVISDSGPIGQAEALKCTELFEPGEEYRVEYNDGSSVTEDTDLWAWCTAEATVTPVISEEPSTQFDVEQTFTSKPQPRDKQRCQDVPIEDPLLEPPKVSGTMQKDKEEAAFDRFGNAVVNSAWELFRGPQNEWDKGRDTIKIVQNVASPLLAYVLPSAFKDCVNLYPIWGYGPRCVKLSNKSFDRKFFGRCAVYYERTLEFDTNVDSFDRDLLDEGTKVLNGHWDKSTGNYVLDKIAGSDPAFSNPQHFIRFKDRQGENTRVLLNGFGMPAGVKVVGQRQVIRTNVGNPYGAVGGDQGWWVTFGATISDIQANEAAGIPLDYTLVTPSPHHLTTGNRVEISGVLCFDGIDPQGNEHSSASQLNDTWFATVVNATAFKLDGSSRLNGQLNLNFLNLGQWSLRGRLTAVIDTTPITIQSANHGLTTGQGVIVVSPDNEQINGNWTVTVTGANSFTLNGSRTIDDEGSTVVGTGTEAVDRPQGVAYIHVEKYTAVDFLLLGIPTSF